MKLIAAFTLGTACALLTACNTTTEPTEQAPQQTNYSARTTLNEGIRYAENTQHDIVKATHHAHHSYNRSEQTLTGQLSTHSRLLAAGGFIAGAIGGS